MNNNKEQIVRKLLNKNMDKLSEQELIESLIDEPIAIDTDKLEDEKRTLGDRLADNITKFAGSWGFIIFFILFLVLWMVINVLQLVTLDPYPFILLNLLLSCIAALQAPIIMMSQNRAAKKDSLRSKNDYKTDLKSEIILEVLYDEIKKLKKNQEKILKIIDKSNRE